MKRYLVPLAAAVLIVPLMAEATLASKPPLAPTPCLVGAATPLGNYAGHIVAANDFEEGHLDGFVVKTEGTGTAIVHAEVARSGSRSAHLHVTADPGSVANFSTVLPEDTVEVYASGWFNISRAGVAGNDVPYFRFFSDETRFADLYRFNDDGRLWLRVLSPEGHTHTRLSSCGISLDEWHHVVMRAVARGDATEIQVWFDESLVFSNVVDSVAASVDRVQLGSEHGVQLSDIHIDDLVVKVAST